VTTSVNMLLSSTTIAICVGAIHAPQTTQIACLNNRLSINRTHTRQASNLYRFNLCKRITYYDCVINLKLPLVKMNPFVKMYNLRYSAGSYSRPDFILRPGPVQKSHSRHVHVQLFMIFIGNMNE
jgi:hypothetical protein